jgi:hypothetical protein
VWEVNFSLFHTARSVFEKELSLSSGCRITSRGLGFKADVDGDSSAAMAHSSGVEGIAHVDLLED